jgi:hypothetical protein
MHHDQNRYTTSKTVDLPDERPTLFVFPMLESIRSSQRRALDMDVGHMEDGRNITGMRHEGT